VNGYKLLKEKKMAKHQECISVVIDKMEPAEKGMLKCILLYGKKIKEDAALQTLLNSTDALGKFGEDVTSDWFSIQLEDIFTEGLGLVDAIKGISYNYGKQLDVMISEILVKSLKVSKPILQKPYDTVDGAIQREAWITEQLMDFMIKSMDEEVKKEFVNQIAAEMVKKGIDPSKVTVATAALLTGGLTAARAIMGFGFHKMVAIIANLLVRMLVGRGLSFAANAALQRMVGILFGPIGWIITAVLTLPLIPSLINPRGYDKYIPAVFVIGITRLSQNNGEEKYDQSDFIKRGMAALSELKHYPESPSLNIKAEVMDAGVFWEDIEVVNGLKLQKNNMSKHYRILDHNKIRIAYGNEAEIGAYFDSILI
jgi:uncharacterized protein YaaW (UPF0174 family)